MKIKFVLASLLVALTLGSCSYRMIDFTVISSKNVQLAIDRSSGKSTEGKSSGFLGFGASIKDAMDKALAAAGPEYDMLVDGVVRFKDSFFVQGYIVTGTAVSSAKLRADLGEDGFEKWCAAHDIFVPEEAPVTFAKAE